MRRSCSRRGDAGFGLLIVVCVLAILGVLSLGAFSIARREFRMAVDLGFAAQALESAEAGLAAAEVGAAGSAAAPLLVVLPGPSAATDRNRYTTSVVRLNGLLFLLSATGERLDPDGQALARRRLGVVGKIEAPVDTNPPQFVRLGSWAWVELHD